MNDKTAIEKAREALVEIANQEVGTWDKPVPFSVLYRRSVDIAREVLAALDAEKYWGGGEVRRSPGIIRTVLVEKDWSRNDELVPVYRIGKVTKSGAIHATANLGYCGITEKDIEQRREG